MKQFLLFTLLFAVSYTHYLARELKGGGREGEEEREE
jgi:hypothetical protein